MTVLSALPDVSKLPRFVVRAVPAAAVLCTFMHLARGGFRGLHTLGWTEAALVLFLLAGLGVLGWWRFTREALSAPLYLRDELELGAVLIASAFIVVAIAGGEVFPLVYLLMAFLVAFLPMHAGLALVGLALAFDGLLLLQGPERSVPSFLTHALFLSLFAGLYHLVLASRIAVARHAESAAVGKRIKEVEEHARTFRLVRLGQPRHASGREGRGEVGARLGEGD